jgi:hypothetical protein
VLAYGQTGSGKTYTSGTAAGSKGQSDDGVLPRLFSQIFEHVEKECIESTVTVSFVEIHLEACRDLLSQTDTTDQITIQQNAGGEIEVSGVKAVPVVSRQQCLQVIAAGTRQRATAATGMNDSSSRSHAIVMIELHQLRRAKPGEHQPREIIRSKFNLVDLAGSERLKRTNAAGARLNEGININHGLLTLGKVITALVEREKASAKGKSSAGIHVPYRESQLTRLLQDSLGGNTRTVMIACVSPAEIDLDATLSTLRYASTARQIRNKPTKNITVDDSAAQIRALQHQVAELEASLANAKEMAVPAPIAENDNRAEEELRCRFVELQGTMEAERAQHKAAQMEWEEWRLEQMAVLRKLQTELPVQMRAEEAKKAAAEWSAKVKEVQQEAAANERRMCEEACALQLKMDSDQRAATAKLSDANAAMEKKAADFTRLEAELRHVVAAHQQLCTEQKQLSAEHEEQKERYERALLEKETEREMAVEEQQASAMALGTMEVTLSEQTEARQAAEEACKEAKEALEAEVSLHAKTKQVHNRSLAANKELRQGLAALKTEYKDSDHAKSTFETQQSAEIDKLRTQAKNLQQKVSMLRAKNAALEEKDSASSGGASAARMEAVHAEVEALTATNKSLHQKLTTQRSKAEESRRRASEALAKSKLDMESAEDRCTSLEEERDIVTKKLVVLRGRYEEQRYKLEDLEGVASELEVSKRTVKETEEAWAAWRTEHEAQLAALQTQVTETVEGAEQTEVVRASLDTALREKFALTKTNAQLSNDLEELQIKYEGEREAHRKALGRIAAAKIATERAAAAAPPAATTTAPDTSIFSGKPADAALLAKKESKSKLTVATKEKERQQELEEEVERLEEEVERVGKENKRLRASQMKSRGKLAESLSAAADMAASVNSAHSAAASTPRTDSGSSSNSGSGSGSEHAASASAVASLEQTILQQQTELLKLKAERDERAEAYARLQASKLEEVGGMLGSLDFEGPAIKHLQGVVARCSRELEEHSRHFYRYKEEKDGMIDRVLVTRLFVSYVSKIKESLGGRGGGGGGRGGGDERATCEEILTVIANMMAFQEADLIKVGLMRDATETEKGAGASSSRKQRSGSTRRRRGSKGASSAHAAAATRAADCEAESHKIQQPQHAQRRQRPPPPAAESRQQVAYSNPMNA